MFFPRGLFAGATTYTHVPGSPGPGRFHNIPAKPSSQVLSHMAFKPDLKVYGITFETVGKEKEGERVIIKIENVGKAASPATWVSAVLTRGDGTHDKHSWAVKALKVHETTTFKWRIRTSAGNNTVKVTVRDSHNRANNTLEKATFVIARNAEKFVHRQALKAERARRALTEKKARGKGALAIRQITFDDHRAKKGNACWVVMRIENTGGAVTPTTPLKVEIHRADGRREQKIFRIRPLMPGKATRIEGFFRMAKGYNTLQIEGIGGVTSHNLTAFTTEERFYRKTHYFNPGMAKSPRKVLAKNRQQAPTGGLQPGHVVVKHSGGLQPTPYGGGGGQLFLPDLRVLSMMMIPSHPTRCDNFDCRVEIANMGGPYDYKIPLNATLYVEGPLGSEPPVKPAVSPTSGAKPINDGGAPVYFEFKLPYPLPASGRYINTVKIYFSGTVVEKDYSNNKLTFSYEVGPVPDLQVWMSRPSDVRVGGPKRWFQVMVKNTGDDSSPQTRLHLHIDGDGNHYYDVPTLAPGETFPAHNRSIKRGIRWWHSGRKKFYAVVDPDHHVKELKKGNNGMFGTLFVYNSSGIRFSPTATVPNSAAIYLKKHGKFEMYKNKHLTFMVRNNSKRYLSRETKFFITIVRVLANGLRQVVYQKAHLWGQLFPGEKHPIIIDYKFTKAGKYEYSATCWVKYPKREFLRWDPHDISGSFQIDEQLIEPARFPEQLGNPPKP